VSIILVSICKYHVTNNREADILVATAVSLLSKSWLPNCGMFSAILFNTVMLRYNGTALAGCNFHYNPISVIANRPNITPAPKEC
jgi:hypothetical protein